MRSNPIYRRRRRTNALLMALSRSRSLRPLLAGVDRRRVLWGGGRAAPVALHADEPAGRRRGMATPLRPASSWRAPEPSSARRWASSRGRTCRVRPARLARAAPASSTTGASAPRSSSAFRVRGVRLAGEAFLRWAGAFALAIIVVPVVVRTTTTREAVPNSLREAAVRSGATWKMITLIPTEPRGRHRDRRAARHPRAHRGGKPSAALNGAQHPVLVLDMGNPWPTCPWRGCDHTVRRSPYDDCTDSPGRGRPHHPPRARLSTSPRAPYSQMNPAAKLVVAISTLLRSIPCAQAREPGDPGQARDRLHRAFGLRQVTLLRTLNRMFVLFRSSAPKARSVARGEPAHLEAGVPSSGANRHGVQNDAFPMSIHDINASACAS